MKKFMFLFLLPLFMFCQSPKIVQDINSPIDSTAYYKAKCDTLLSMKIQYEKYLVSYENENTRLNTINKIANDSIVFLNNRLVMTPEQFIELYKYSRLLKYYTICKNKPSQWKYYKGWSIRVFEQ